MNLALDNHDRRIRYFSLMLESYDVSNVTQYPLPAGYHFTYYRPGDRDDWIEIEKSAKEFTSWEQGLSAWNTYYEGHDEELINRLFFIETDSGEKVATATAYYDVLGKDTTGSGWLHWVAVKREYQGRGLARPLISRTLRRLAELEYKRIVISTQTVTWVACKLYMDFGFKPTRESSSESLCGWRIMKALTNHPCLKDYEPASKAEVLCIENCE